MSANDKWTEAYNKATQSIKEYLQNNELKSEVRCECGVDHVGTGRHSPWCPKYDKSQWW